MKHYLYRHIRPDTNKVFYVGVGTKQDDHDDTFENEYARAFKRHSRNPYWHNVYEKCGQTREVEIMLESDDYDWILEKEIEFIALYGRADLGLGTLVNLTDGGEGVKGHKMSERAKAMIAEAHLGRKHTEEHKANLSKALKGRIFSPKHREAISKAASNRPTKPVLQYSSNGDLVTEWPSIRDASKGLGYNKTKSGIFRCCNGYQATSLGFVWKWKTNEN